MSEYLVLDLPATYKMLAVLRAIIAEIIAGIPDATNVETTTYNVQLSVQEIAVNIIEHAYGGESNDKRFSTTISLTDHPYELVIEIRDTGAAFDPTTITPPNLDVPQEGGYGLFLAQQLMDKVQYISTVDHNEWQMVKKLTW